MTALRCAEALDVIQSYVDGECDVHAAVAVAAHLDVCGGCENAAATYLWLKAALRRQRIEDPEAVARLCAFAALLTRRCR